MSGMIIRIISIEMKRTFFLAIFIIFFTISFMSLVGCDNQILIKEQSSVPEKTLKDDYELQEMCKTLGDKYFREQYLSEASYRSHYNRKLNKCFLLMEDGRKTSKDLYNVNASIHYGMFFHDEDGIYCNVLETECKSEKEWDKLVKPYMED